MTKLPQSPFVPHNIKQPIFGNRQGPLSGLSVVVKDMYDIAGERAGGGSPAWLAHHDPAERHSAVVQALINSGATIIGKTICDEFLYSVTGINAHYGTPLNPRAPDRIPGGSSSGSAAACAAGCCDIAVGSDTGGSVRVPAALCGIYGIRASQGRIDMTGAMTMAPSLDSAGWFASSPGVFKLAATPLLTGRGDDRVVTRVMVLQDAFDNAETMVAELCRTFLKAASTSLPSTKSVQIAGEKIDTWREAMRVRQAFETWKTYGPFLSRARPNLGPGVAERMAIAASVTDDQYHETSGVLEEAKSRAKELAEPGTILVLPTAPCIAPLLATSHEQLDAYRVGVMRLVCIASISGLPQVSIPIGTVNQAPVGLSLIGWPSGDEALLITAEGLARHVGIAR